MGRRGVWGWILLAFFAAYPFIPGAEAIFSKAIDQPMEKQLTTIFVFSLLALGLNVVVGWAGLLQLGIAAFFALGAYTTGVLTVETYPFQLGFWGAIVLAPLVAGGAGAVLGVPTLRLRGDYLAIVTLGFGEVVRVTLLNLDAVTGGPQGLNPIPPPAMPAVPGLEAKWHMYYLSLGALAAVVVFLGVLERSRLGRAWKAVREDELAAACMGINTSRVKLGAFAFGAAIAGLAGVLYATKITTTAEPNTYDFTYSIMVLCCVIIGGIGSIPGTLLGAFVLLGFDNILTPLMAAFLQDRLGTDAGSNVMFIPSNWRWLIFGLALVVTMRFRPQGLLPARRGGDRL